MPKQRVPVNTHLTFKEYLDKFDAKVLSAAVVQLEGSIAWQLMQSYLKLRQREFEVASLDLIGHGKTHESSKASGYAQACEDAADHFMQQLHDSVNGYTGLVEGPVREDQ